ncbi:MAG: SIS domain-containing protein [Treponema sp.]|nr:SIS domain-containing protein [Treponema sp.]
MTLPDYILKASERKAHPYYMWDGICGIESSLGFIRDIYTGDATGLAGIAARLAAKKRIYFIGCGTSYYNGVAAQFIFNRIGGISAAAAYALEFSEFPPPDLQDCAVIGISHTGGTASVIEALNRANAGGAYTLAVTDVEDSAISATARSTLPGYGGREPSLPKTRSYLAALMKLCYLAAELALVRGGDPRDFVKELGGAPEKAGGYLKETEGPMKNLAANLYKAVYLFGSGINLGSVSEAALKLQESAQIISIPFELEEGMHGPWVTMNRGDLVTVLHFDGLYYNKSLELIRALSRIGVDLLVITNRPGFAEKVKQLVFINEKELMSPFYTVLPLYQLAYFSALEKGNNPDFMRLWEEPYLAARLSLPR